MFKKSISLVMPVFNEEEIIEETIDIFVNSLSALFYDYEILVVNDGSLDATAEILNRISTKNPKIRIFHNYKNLGSGVSLWRGFKESTKELILSNFADRPFDLMDLKFIVPLFDSKELDFVIIVRGDRGANSLFRKLTSYINFLLIRLLFDVKINDFQFVQIYRKSVFSEINIVSTGTFVPPELMIRLVSRGGRYEQVRCKFHRRTKGKSKCGRLSEYAKTFKEMITFRFILNQNVR